MKGDFLSTITISTDCHATERRQAFIDGPKIATAQRKPTLFSHQGPLGKIGFLEDWLTGKDACGRVI
jgi:hypothetical protein